MVLQVFLGENFLPFLVLAIGGAMVVGPAFAILKPREENREGDLVKAPIGRSLVQIFIGLIATIWALVSLLT